MNFKSVLLFFIFISLSPSGFAGVGFEGALGYPTATIVNPDETRAFYSGIAISGRFVIPMIESNLFDANFEMIGRYLDLNNTASSAAQRETGNHMGLGAGLSFRLGKLYLGADYLRARARHFFVGNKDEYLEFEMNQMNYFAGLKFQSGRSLSIAITHSMSSGPIDSKDTGLSANSQYSDGVTWLHLTYETNEKLLNFLSALFH